MSLTDVDKSLHLKLLYKFLSYVVIDFKNIILLKQKSYNRTKYIISMNKKGCQTYIFLIINEIT